MSGRGDNNKNGSSGQGASNQSGQGQSGTKDREKMNHGEQTGGKPSERQKPSEDTSSDRNAPAHKSSK